MPRQWFTYLTCSYNRLNLQTHMIQEYCRNMSHPSNCSSLVSNFVNQYSSMYLNYSHSRMETLNLCAGYSTMSFNQCPLYDPGSALPPHKAPYSGKPLPQAMRWRHERYQSDVVTPSSSRTYLQYHQRNRRSHTNLSEPGSASQLWLVQLWETFRNEFSTSPIISRVLAFPKTCCTAGRTQSGHLTTSTNGFTWRSKKFIEIIYSTSLGWVLLPSCGKHINHSSITKSWRENWHPPKPWDVHRCATIIVRSLISIGSTLHFF